MKQYDVQGMHCAACSARVEKAVSKVEGVSACSVSLLTNSMGVEGTASASDIIAAVEHAGYHAAMKGAEDAQSRTNAVQEDALKDRETPVLRRRLIASVIFLLVLMYVSMGHCMWGWPVPDFFKGNPVAIGLVQMILAAIVMIINKKFFCKYFLFSRSPCQGQELRKNLCTKIEISGAFSSRGSDSRLLTKMVLCTKILRGHFEMTVIYHFKKTG